MSLVRCLQDILAFWAVVTRALIGADRYCNKGPMILTDASILAEILHCRWRPKVYIKFNFSY